MDWGQRDLVGKYPKPVANEGRWVEKYACSSVYVSSCFSSEQRNFQKDVNVDLYSGARS